MSGPISSLNKNLIKKKVMFKITRSKPAKVTRIKREKFSFMEEKLKAVRGNNLIKKHSYGRNSHKPSLVATPFQ
jgi:hypothetical protein